MDGSNPHDGRQDRTEVHHQRRIHDESPDGPVGAESPFALVRAFSVAAFLIVAFSIIIPYSELYLQGSTLVPHHLPVIVVFTFLVLLTLNVLLRRMRWGLSRREILFIYVLLLVSAAIPANGFVMNVVPLLPAPWHYADETNGWKELFFRHIPDWSTPASHQWASPADSLVIAGFYRGGVEDVPWGRWIGPLFWWAVIGGAFFAVYLCLASLLRRQWMDRERLSFPLAEIPLAMTEGDQEPSITSPIFRSPYLWAGIAIPVLLYTINGLSFYVPAVPTIQTTGLQFGSIFAEGPFRVWQNLRIDIYTSLIGICYLLRVEMSLSFVVFFALYQLYRFGFDAAGIPMAGLDGLTWPSFSRYHQAGALVGFALVILWASRRELWLGFLGGFGLRRITRQPDEIMSPATAARGLLVGTVVIIVWALSVGAQWFVAVLLFLILLCMMIVLTRLVAAGGMLWVTGDWDPIHIMAKTMGTGTFSPSTLVLINYWTMTFTWHPEQFLMPYIMDGLRITQRGRLSPRWVLIGIVGALALAMVTSAIFMISFIYERGGSYLSDTAMHQHPVWALNLFATYLKNPSPPDVWPVWFLLSGMAAALVLVTAHRSFVWWPVYPLAYCIGATNLIMTFWFPALIGLSAKRIIYRAGGSRAYEKARPAFLGMIFGEFFMVGLWVLVDAAFGKTGHVILTS